MSPKKQIPEFQTEAEEARWYYDHQDDLEDYLEPMAEDDTPLHIRLNLPPRQKAETRQVQLRIPVLDIERARRLAARKGLRYQTYIQRLLHEALEQEEIRKG